jgi:hypothetical protein
VARRRHVIVWVVLCATPFVVALAGAKIESWAESGGSGKFCGGCDDRSPDVTANGVVDLVSPRSRVACADMQALIDDVSAKASSATITNDIHVVGRVLRKPPYSPLAIEVQSVRLAFERVYIVGDQQHRPDTGKLAQLCADSGYMLRARTLPPAPA